MMWGKTKDWRKITFAGTLFTCACTIGSLGEALIKGVRGVEVVVSVYIRAVNLAAEIFFFPMSALGLTLPNQNILDIIVLTNAGLGFMVWRLWEIPLSFRATVVALINFSLVLIGYSFPTPELIQTLLVFVAIVLLLGSMTVLSSQRIFSRGEVLEFRRRGVFERTILSAPSKELFAKNLLSWPLVWYYYNLKTFWLIVKNFISTLAVILLIMISGLLLSQLAQRADETLPAAKRFGDAVDTWLADL